MSCPSISTVGSVSMLSVCYCSEIFHVHLGAGSNMITIEAVAGCLRFLPIFGSCSGTILSNVPTALMLNRKTKKIPHMTHTEGIGEYK